MKFEIGGKGAEALARFDLDPKKPAILLLDAESALLDKQQLCVNPPDYEKRIKKAFHLNGRRVDQREKFAKQERKIRRAIEEEEFDKALRRIEGLLKKRDQLIGSVLFQVERDLADAESKAKELLDKAAKLEEENKLLASREIYKKVKKEFERIPEAHLLASKRVRVLNGKLKRLGL